MLRTADKRLFVGQQLSSVVAPPVIAGRPPLPMLSPICDEFAVSQTIIQNTAGTIPTSGVWPATSVPVGCEFWIQEPITVYQLGWLNGSGTMTDSADIGIYDSSNNRKVSGGGTPRSGVSALQFVDVADTVLSAGRYRLVMSNNGTTANQSSGWTGFANAVMWGMVGLFDSATTAYPLPDPITNFAAAATAVTCPVMFIATRTLV